MKNRLIELRKNLGLSQKAFGEPLNLSQSAIAGYEVAVRNMTDRTIADICRVYNVNPDWLKNGNGEMFEAENSIDILLKGYNALNTIGKQKVVNYVADLVGNKNYTE